MLTACVRVQLSARVFNFHLKLSASAISRALEMEMLQEVSCARAFQSLMSRACPNKHANSGHALSLHCFGADPDSVLSHGHLHRSIELERGGDLTTLQITEVLRRRLSRELEIAFLFGHSFLKVLHLLNFAIAINLVSHHADG